MLKELNIILTPPELAKMFSELEVEQMMEFIDNISADSEDKNNFLSLTLVGYDMPCKGWCKYTLNKYFGEVLRFCDINAKEVMQALLTESLTDDSNVYRDDIIKLIHSLQPLPF